MTPPLPVFHYTKGFHLPSIGKSGILRPASGMGVRTRPVLWFSTNSEWERTVDCGSWWDGEDEDACPGGYVRISVKREAAPYRWSDYRRLGGEDPVFLKALAKTAREVGAEVRQWRVSFDPVPRDLWLGAQVWFGGSWEDINLIYDFPEGWGPKEEDAGRLRGRGSRPRGATPGLRDLPVEVETRGTRPGTRRRCRNSSLYA